MKAISIRRFRRPDPRIGAGNTKCLDCSALRHGVTRERCRQHVRKTGHRVEFAVEHVTVYGPEESA